MLVLASHQRFVFFGDVKDVTDAGASVVRPLPSVSARDEAVGIDGHIAVL